MYPYDDENRINGEQDAERGESAHVSYTDAGYVPESEATMPRSYPTPPEQKPREPKQKKPMGAGGIIALCLVCALIGGVAGGAIVSSQLDAKPVASAVPTLTTVQLPAATPTATQLSGTVSAKDVYELGCEQTVGITTEITTRNVFGMPTSRSVTGSGFIITSDGYIMTNYHVVEAAYSGGYNVTVMLHSGELHTADIVGFDAENDVAVLKIDGANLPAATLGDSDSIAVGDTVFAIGNPLGELAYSMTSGIISSTDRVITTDEHTSINMFQIDAAVNSGNSGGPVYNSAGQVVGVVTAKYSDTGVEGLGFAIPINDAVRIARDVMEHGYVTGKGFLGVSGETVNALTAQYYNMPQGCYVTGVTPESAAAKAGIEKGDVIVQIGEKTILSRDELSSTLKSLSAGDTVDVIVWRSGQYMTLSTTLDEYVPANATTQG